VAISNSFLIFIMWCERATGNQKKTYWDLPSQFFYGTCNAACLCNGKKIWKSKDIR